MSNIFASVSCCCTKTIVIACQLSQVYQSLFLSDCFTIFNRPFVLVFFIKDNWKAESAQPLSQTHALSLFALIRSQYFTLSLSSSFSVKHSTHSLCFYIISILHLLTFSLSFCVCVFLLFAFTFTITAQTLFSLLLSSLPSLSFSNSLSLCHFLLPRRHLKR